MTGEKDVAGAAEVVDEAEDLETEGEDLRYTISSYGADYPVDSLVSRLERGDIVVPPFQRGYVWTHPQASRFIESLLLGLPVPGIFFSKEEESQKLLVIDGQQRLLTLQYWKQGAFPNRGFDLVDVRKSLLGKTIHTLSEEDKRRLNDSIIHATIIRQEGPPGDQSGVFSVFQRLNTGATLLQPQEIRTAIYQGPFIKLLGSLNGNPAWRSLYGTLSSRGKDQELILRFLALYSNEKEYERPMKSFLNGFTQRNRYLDEGKAKGFTQCFERTISLVAEAIGPRAFRPQKTLNAAVFDAVMVGLARRLDRGPITDRSVLNGVYIGLESNEEFQNAYTRATADEEQVHTRIRVASSYFSKVP